MLLGIHYWRFSEAHLISTHNTFFVEKNNKKNQQKNNKTKQKTTTKKQKNNNKNTNKKQTNKKHPKNTIITFRLKQAPYLELCIRFMDLLLESRLNLGNEQVLSNISLV